MKDNDPDTLQLSDELDTEWVKLWRRATKKKKSAQKELTLNITLAEKEIQLSAKFKYKKTV